MRKAEKKIQRLYVAIKPKLGCSSWKRETDATGTIIHDGSADCRHSSAALQLSPEKTSISARKHSSTKLWDSPLAAHIINILFYTVRNNP